MTLRLTDEQTEALRRRAEAEHRSMQQVALAAIDAYVHRPAALRRREAVDVGELLDAFADLPPIDADAFRMSFQAVDIARLLIEIHSTYEPLFASRHQRLLIEGTSCACVVRADSGRLIQAFSNVLANALKFTPAGGRVLLRLVDRGPAIDVEVTDSGPGIPAKNLQLVTKRFWQEDTQGERGLGLGLYIVDRIVAAHGGQLVIESAPDRGTTVRVSLTVTPS